MGRKWANIVAKKTAKDGANSKVYAKFGVEIYVAAKQGEPDPESNSALKFVLERAKQAQVPKHVIDKAIDKAKGNTDETFVEGRYEGFGPNGSMIIVDTLTSNVNRTAANVRTAFGKNGGNMGASGSVSYMFDKKGVIVFAGEDADAIFEQLLEADVEVEDVEAEDGTITVYTEPTDLHKALEALRANGQEEFQVTELEMIPQTEVTLEGEDLEVFEGLIDALEADYVAAKQGEPDPESNSALKFVLERAKQAQVPKHVIDKAIDKAKGNTDETFVEGRYEGFGPNGSMIIVDTLTSNVNRTAANVRTAFGKNGGNMGASGSVSYMFDKKGVIVFAGEDADAIFEQLLEADVEVEDVEAEDGTITVYTEPTDLHKALEALRANGQEEFQVTELEMIPQTEVTLEGEDLEVFEGLIDALEADDDVQKVYHNVADM